LKPKERLSNSKSSHFTVWKINGKVLLVWVVHIDVRTKKRVNKHWCDHQPKEEFTLIKRVQMRWEYPNEYGSTLAAVVTSDCYITVHTIIAICYLVN
jgi:hypothetical protein